MSSISPAAPMAKPLVGEYRGLPWASTITEPLLFRKRLEPSTELEDPFDEDADE